jgi:type II secretory pathway component PulF
MMVLGAVTVTFIKIFSSRNMRESLLKKIPVLSSLKRELFAMNFFSVIEVLIRERVHLIDCLECASDIGNRREISEIIEDLKNGSMLSTAMKKSKLFSDYEMSIIKTGENSGDLWPAFKTGSEFLKRKVSERTKKLISLIQPITILFMGLLLIVIVYSIIVPMYSNLDL